MSATNQTSKQLIRGTSIVALLTLLSRFFGFIRDLLVARLFGASLIADCFFVAFRIPNLLRSLVGEGALSSAFVPIFTSELKTGKERAQAVISVVIGFLSIITFILTILGIIFAEEILQVIAPGFLQKDNTNLCVLLTQIMMPYIMCVSLVAMLNGALNSVNVFGAAALAQVLMNIVLIFGALIAGRFDEINGVKILSYSVIAGGVVQVLIQIPALSKAGFKFRPNFKIFTPVISDLMKLMAPAIFGATIYQISQFLNTLFASLLITGSVSWLFYADRLTQLPLGIFSIALASVLLPTLSKANADSNQKDFAAHLRNSLRYTGFFIIPLSGIIFYYAEPLISILFERGEFSKSDTSNTALAVKAYATGLWAVSCYSMISRGFIAKKDTLTPTIVGVLTLFMGIIFSLMLMGPFANTATAEPVITLQNFQNFLASNIYAYDLDHAGLALSASLAAFFSLIVLSVILTIRHFNPGWLEISLSTLKALAATILSLLIASKIDFLPLSPLPASIIQILITGALYLGFSLVIKSREAQEVTRLIYGRIVKG